MATPDGPDFSFEEVVRRERDGRLLIGVDRAFARRFYTDISLRTVEQHTGEAPYLGKLVVFGAWVGGPLALISSAVLAALVVGWWSALLIPIGFILWFFYYSISSRGDSRLTFLSILLVVAVVLLVASSSERRSLWALASIYIAALWLGRFVYSSSTTLLRGFILRNPRAYAWLRGNLILRGVE